MQHMLRIPMLWDCILTMPSKSIVGCCVMQRMLRVPMLWDCILTMASESGMGCCITHDAAYANGTKL